MTSLYSHFTLYNPTTSKCSLPATCTLLTIRSTPCYCQDKYRITRTSLAITHIDDGGYGMLAKCLSGQVYNGQVRLFTCTSTHPLGLLTLSSPSSPGSAVSLIGLLGAKIAKNQK